MTTSEFMTGFMLVLLLGGAIKIVTLFLAVSKPKTNRQAERRPANNGYYSDRLQAEADGKFVYLDGHPHDDGPGYYQ